MKLDKTEPKILKWTNRLKSANCTINKLTPLSIQEKPNGELLFAYINADVTSPEGYKINPIIHLRGDAVLIVPEIINRETGEKKFLMVKQRRIATGKLNLEFPAGMLDRNVNNPPFTAINELAEETGLEISESDLFPLSTRALYSTPGACDEAIWFYGIKIALSDSEFNSFDGRIRINDSENERIEVCLRDEKQFLDECESLQAVLAYHLYKQRS